MSEAVRARAVVKVGDTAEPVDDWLVAEEPMEIRLEGTPLAVVMRTPGDDAELTLGFPITEGIVTGPAEVATIEDLGEGRWNLRLADGVVVDAGRFQRNLYATSSCGVCGKASIDAIRVAGAKPAPGPLVTPGVLATLPQRLLDQQTAFRSTGGIHGAGAFRADGSLMAVREDVGRHNAVDKVIGAISAHSWPLPPLGLMVSGRVSFEIAQKAAVAGVGLVAGVSAASSLAVELGEELGLTVIGFLRHGGFTVYTGSERVVGLG